MMATTNMTCKTCILEDSAPIERNLSLPTIASLIHKLFPLYATPASQTMENSRGQHQQAKEASNALQGSSAEQLVNLA